LSDSDAEARFLHEVAQAHLATIVKVGLKSDLFAYEIDQEALARVKLMDGKLLLVTKVTAMTPAEVVTRYKSLADIERGFRVLKSEIEIAPVYHRPPWRIRAHAGICFMALILHRVMRQRLRLAGHKPRPRRRRSNCGASSATACASTTAHPSAACPQHTRSSRTAGRIEDQEAACRHPDDAAVVPTCKVNPCKSTVYGGWCRTR
jgi:hypothetical protein